MSATVGSALRWWARTKPDHSALVVDDERLSYRQLDHWSSRVARRLAEWGITPGDRVGLSATNCLAWPVAAHGVLKC
ncbi:MAG TPA: AMP-binding protein, partial [Mycobacterium sp.]